MTSSQAGTAAALPAHAVPRRAWSHKRLGAATVLASWSCLFWFLILADRVTLYLSSRTAWVVPMAAVILSVSALSVVVASRVTRPEPIRVREAVGLAVLLAPVVLLLALPPTTLGSFSASRKAAFSGSGLATLPSTLDGTREITLLTIAAADGSAERSEQLAKRAGERVRFVGFVAGDRDDEFILARYMATCCAADALVVSVRVVSVTPGTVRADEWVEVTGRIYPIGDEVIVEAEAIRHVPRPAEPYLGP